MKKTYCTPCAHTVMLQPLQMLAASNEKSIGVVSNPGQAVDAGSALSGESVWSSENWAETEE